MFHSVNNSVLKRDLKTTKLDDDVILDVLLPTTATTTSSNTCHVLI